MSEPAATTAVQPGAISGEPRSWQVGDVVDDRYRVLEVLGQGGMGVVHRVRHLAWDMDLAVKSPRQEWFRGADDRERFVGEAETWVSLGLHPHVCGCHYVRVLDGIPRVFAEYVPGGSLSERISDLRLYRGGWCLAPATILDVAIQMAWGLEHAHHRGLVHQDVKPANILLDADGTAKITDFGLARARAVVTGSPDGAGSPDISVPVGGGGGMTPAYASPEQAAGRPVTRRTDIYSFAVSVLEMYTGGVTWRAGPAAGEALKVRRAEGPNRAVLPELPSGVADLLAACLHEDPGHRPASMAEVAAELVSQYQAAARKPYPRPEPLVADLRGDELNNRAVSLLDLGRPAEAEDAFARALAADPQHLEATYNAGLSRWRRGETTDEELLAEIEAVGAHTSAPGAARNLLAQVQLERGDRASARVLLDELELEYPGDPDIEATVGVLGSEEFGSAAGGTVRDVPWYTYPAEVWPPTFPIRLTPDGRFALTGSWDGTMRLWDLRDGRCALSVGGHEDGVSAVDISADGCFGISAGWDSTVWLWNLTTGECLRRFTTSEASRGIPAGSVRLDAGTRVAAAAVYDGPMSARAESDRGRVVVWDLRTGQHRLTLDGHNGSVAVEMSADGRLALTSGRPDGTVRLWDLDTGTCRQVLRECGRSVSAMALSSDGRFALTGEHYSRAGGLVHLWDLDTGQRVRTLTGHTRAVQTLALSEDARFALSGGSVGDNTVRLWALERGRCLRTFRGNQRQVSAVALDPDAGSVVSAGEDNTARRWDWPSGYECVPRLSLPRRHAELSRLASRAAELVAEAARETAAGDHAAALDLLTRARSVPGHERAAGVLSAWRALGRTGVRVGLRAAWSRKILAGHAANILSVAVAADGRLAVTNGSDEVTRLWDVDSGDCLHAVRAKLGSVGLSADGQRFMSAAQFGDIAVWSVDTGECLSALDWKMTGGAGLARFSADGRLALACTHEHGVRLWDLRDGRSPRTLEHAADAVWLGPDGRMAATAGRDGTVRLWDLATGELVRALAGPTAGVTSVCVSSDGNFVLTSGDYSDPTIRLWDARTGDRVRLFDQQPGHANAVSLSTDGRFAISGGEDSTVRVWDVTSGQCLRVLEGHQQRVIGVAFTPDAQLAVSWSIDTARLWELDWELAMRKPADWDDGAAPYLAAFLAQHGSRWAEADLAGLVRLLQDAGYGWLRVEGVRARLAAMANDGIPR